LDKDGAFILDILIAARLVRQFVEGETWETFSENQMLESAVRYQEQVMGEAAGQVSTEFRRAHREVPWERLIGLRHGLVHGYRDIELRRLWRLAQNDVGRTISLLEGLVPPDDQVQK
jgi:uncharacterized protein with HEPN domain